jgi:transcriptional regulator with XRE-family HTH domain
MSNESNRPTLASTLAEARTAEGLGIRELARRSGLAPSQLSRIESGRVERPDSRTLIAVARALGRSWVALDYLADPLQGDEEGLLVNSIEEQTVLRDLGRFTDKDFDYLRERAGLDESEPTIARFCEFAHALFVYVTLADRLERFAGSLGNVGVESEQIEGLIRDWLGLGSDRRALVAGYLAEQAVLSELDRRGANPQKVRLDVRRQPAEDGA